MSLRDNYEAEQRLYFAKHPKEEGPAYIELERLQAAERAARYGRRDEVQSNTPSIAAPPNPTLFHNEWERRMGVAVGMGVDGDFSEDALRRKQMSDALKAADQRDQAAVDARRLAASPLDYSNPTKLSVAQQALPFGRQFLAEMNGYNYKGLVESGVNMRGGESLPELGAYRADRGTTDAYGNVDALDQRIASHPDFAKLMGTHPEVAREVYSRLRSMQGQTPSNYDEDMKSSEKFRTTKFATVAKDQHMEQQGQRREERQEIFKGLSDGSYHDPQLGKWIVPTLTETPDPSSATGARIRKIVNQPATPYLQQLYDRHGFEMLGTEKKLPETRGQKEWEFRQKRQDDLAPSFQRHRARMEAQSGLTMTPEELNHLANLVEMEGISRIRLPGEFGKMGAENEAIWSKVFAPSKEAAEYADSPYELGINSF